MLRKDLEKRGDKDGLLKEKDEIIKQVMAEGETLSKKQMEMEASIKKLRTQLKEFEVEKERLASRLSVEEARAQTIKADKKQIEDDMQGLVERSAAELADQKAHYVAELTKAKEARLEAEARADSEQSERLSKQLKQAHEREAVLVASVEELQAALARAATQATHREDLMRRDLHDMEARCQAAEARHEELAERIPEATRPLLRQIEAMQRSASERSEAWAMAERALQSRLAEAEARADEALDKEVMAAEQAAGLQAKVAVVEQQLAAERADSANLQRLLDAEKKKVDDSRKQGQAYAEQAAQQEGRLSAIEEETLEREGRLRQSLAEERGRLEVRESAFAKEREEMRARERELLAQQRELSAQLAEMRREPGGAPAASRDPTTPRGGLEFPVPASGVAVVGPVAAQVERLQTLLRQRQQELEYQEVRIEKLEATREQLANELVATSKQAAESGTLGAEVKQLRTELTALQEHHIAAVELLGERDEQVEELEADLISLRTLVKQQAEQLSGKA